MSEEENVELVLFLNDAWNRRDYPAALERFAPEIKVESHLGGNILDGTYEGIAGLQELFAGFWSSFADFHAEIDECIAGDEQVAFLAHVYGRGRGSGIEVETRYWGVFTVREGRIVRYRLFRTKPPALEAAGLSEQCFGREAATPLLRQPGGSPCLGRIRVHPHPDVLPVAHRPELGELHINL